MTYVNASDFGFRTTATGAENQAALQRALNTGEDVVLPTGSFRITGEVELKAQGQALVGVSDALTVLKVEGPARGEAVVDTNHQHFARIADFRIEFSQDPGADTRSELRHYQPGIQIDATRVNVSNVLIANASTGIKAIENFGGLEVNSVEVSAFDYGFDLGHSTMDDGSHALDTVTMNDCRTWPHRMTPALRGLYFDGQAYGFALGNIDDFKATDLHPYRAKLVVSGDDFDGQITGLSLDGERAKLIVDGDASLRIVGMYASATYSEPVYSRSETKVEVTGAARLTVQGYELNTAAQSVPLVRIANRDANALFSNGIIQQPCASGNAFLVTAGHLGAFNNRFLWSHEWKVKNAYFIDVLGESSSANISGNTIADRPDDVSGSGGFARITSSHSSNLIGPNATGGWSIAYNSAGSQGGSSVLGGAGNDVLAAGTGRPSVRGFAGADRVYGSALSDKLYGDEGNDTISAGSASDLLSGGSGHDVLYGGSGNDSLFGLQDRDVIYGKDGADMCRGGDGCDTVFGGEGSDTIYGENDRDILFADAGNDFVFGGAGNDVIRGGHGFDVIRGGLHNDTIYGEDGNDRLSGDQGRDTLNGGLGADVLDGGSDGGVLIGGAGRDTLVAGNGSDLMVLAKGAIHADILVGFDDRSDKVQLSGHGPGDFRLIDHRLYADDALVAVFVGSRVGSVQDIEFLA